MTDALIRNEMGILGDVYYLTVAPLRLEFIFDFAKSTEVIASERAAYTIQDVLIYTGRGPCKKTHQKQRLFLI